MCLVPENPTVLGAGRAMKPGPKHFPLNKILDLQRICKDSEEMSYILFIFLPLMVTS